VSGVQIRNGAIFANKIAPGAVTGAKIAGTAAAANGDVLTADGAGNAAWTPAPQDTADQVRDKFFAGTSCTNPNNPNDVMVRVGPLCVDKYEASIWANADGTGTAYGVFTGQTAYPASFPANGNWTAPLYAASMPGVKPSTQVTWFQAQQACEASGKRLLRNGEWQMAAAGTPDPGTAGDGTTTCNTQTTGVVNTGNAAACTSKRGVNDMVGNVWEWVEDWVQGNTNPWAPSTTTTNATYGSDWMFGANPATSQGGGANMPAALVRGGNWADGAGAGVFALIANGGPSVAGSGIGFRCAR